MVIDLMTEGLISELHVESPPLALHTAVSGPFALFQKTLTDNFNGFISMSE